MRADQTARHLRQHLKYELEPLSLDARREEVRHALQQIVQIEWDRLDRNWPASIFA